MMPFATKFVIVNYKLFRDNDIDECSLEMVFAADFEKLGKVENHELKPGGAEIAVTEENKAEYIRYLIQSFLHDTLNRALYEDFTEF